MCANYGRMQASMYSGAQIATVINRFYNHQQYFPADEPWGVKGRVALKKLFVVLIQNPDNLSKPELEALQKQIASVFLTPSSSREKLTCSPRLVR